MNKEVSLPSVVFFGTPEFAKYCLAYLIKASFPVLAVVTSPDRKSGRGKKITASAVKDYALYKKIPVLQPVNLKSFDFIDKLKKLNAEIYAVVAFRMLPEIVWSLPPFGTINLHASLLPNYRGAAPINWVLINGEKETGVTTFLIDGEIDSGAILMRESIQILSNYNFEILNDKLLKIGAPLLGNTLLKLYSKSIIAKRQEVPDHLKMAPKLNSEKTNIKWNNPLEVILNQIRGLSPYPGAWTTLNNNGEYLRIKIFDAETKKIVHFHDKGQVIEKDYKLMITTADGYLICKEIQLPNKKRMSASALLNGYSIDPNARIH